MQIFNTKYSSKKGASSNNFIRTSLVANNRLIPTTDYISTIDEAEVYNSERESCDKHRLIVTIKPMCSNVLFNRITEVSFKEGSDECVLLNDIGNNVLASLDGEIKCYGEKTIANNFKAKYNEWGAVMLTRDTQLTSDDRINYKCGIDIFNNHILRNKTFKCVCYGHGPNFNTLLDMLRDSQGKTISGYTSDKTQANYKEPLHLYLSEDVMTFSESVDVNLIEDNGWVGFKNAGQIVTYDNNGKAMPINHAINNKPSCGFVDMCPERDLWYFSPKYNEYRNRYEKNWNYCLTYPSSSVTSGIDFIRESSNSLRIFYFEDSYVTGGAKMCKIVSCSKHGLSVQDRINMYVSGSDLNGEEDTVIRNLEVMKVEDDYTFYVKYSEQDWILDENFVTWKTSSSFDLVSARMVVDDNGDLKAKEQYIWSDDKKYVYRQDKPTAHIPVFISKDKYKANLSLKSNDVSFKQIVDGDEVDYYVRIFSKLPNWKFAKTKISDFEDNRDELIKKYSQKQYDFQSHISKLAFAKTIYTDEVSQIVFTDDINLNGLTDNLGRPLTNIYLTIVKNNAGYRDWYGKNGANIVVNKESVEFSHVFGKITCGFQLADATMGFDYKNLTQLNNIESEGRTNGLSITSINGQREMVLDDDEIEYNQVASYGGDTNFYGDLCMYIPTLLEERVIDDVWFRFNTAQRELTVSDKSYPFLNTVAFEEITQDDYDVRGFENDTIDKQMQKDDGKTRFVMNHWSLEGYIYKPHYKIPIRTFSRTLQELVAHHVNVVSIENNGQYYEVTTDRESYIEPREHFIMHNKATNVYYDCVANDDSFITTTKFKFTCQDLQSDEFFAASNYVIIKHQETVPSTAVLLKDGTYRYVWRDVLQNGFDEYGSVEVYPFTNGALYIEKNIQFFCRRQDPKQLLTKAPSFIRDIAPKIPSALELDNYINNEDITCF